MIETDILKLNKQPGHSLDALEVDIWRGVAARAEVQRISKFVLASQAVVLAIAVIGSIAAGSHFVASVPASQLGVFSTRAELTPTTLLLGGRR